MARKIRKAQSPSGTQTRREEISVEALRDISILFPGDVYRLAVWVAMSDRAVSTPTARRGTTLRGLAKHFVSLASSPEQLTIDEVMDRFREHGLEGNEITRLPPETDTVAPLIAGDDASPNEGDPE
ncbi:MAG: hypothetical protein WD049_05480 [Candidatus Paceibacterota bacterium]